MGIYGKGNNMIEDWNNQVWLGDAKTVLDGILYDIYGKVDLIYIDPPFNTKTVQASYTTVSKRDEDGTEGFGGYKYKRKTTLNAKYLDKFNDYHTWLMDRLVVLYEALKSDGSFYFHIDYREVHKCRLMLDYLFGEENFMNEIIWAFDYGGRSKKKWPSKHQNILFYVKNIKEYTWNYDEVDRLPYMAPKLVSQEKRERGKFPTDVWWNTIVHTLSSEKMNYPNQKPRAIIDRIVKASSNPGDLVLDCFAGSGTTGESALELDRKFLLIDSSPSAFEVMKRRFAGEDVFYTSII